MVTPSRPAGGRFRTLQRAAGAVLRGGLLLASIVLGACGGGGGGNSFSPPPPPSPPPAGGGWQPGVFLDADTFFARCRSPRPNSQDLQGTVTDENNFLRSYSNDTYLWYDEILDRDPGGYNDPLAYFDTLVTTARTPSGALKDKFHFTFDTEEWEQLSQSGVSAGYGVQLAFVSSSPPREVRVAYTEPNSPASNLPVPLERGAEFIRADGVSVRNGDAGALNDAFFPSAAGETHTFEVRDRGAQTNRTITMTSATIVSAPVQNTKVIVTPTGRIGYMLFNDHIATAEQALIDAIDTLNSGQGIDDLVLDIRYNGGGYLAIASQLAYMIAGNGPTAGQTFELLQFNDKHPNTNPITGTPILPTPFYNITLGPPFNGGPAGQALPTLGLSRVYVITGPGTCSASEAIMNGLRGVNVQVVQIGSTTCGKPYGFYATDNCGTTYFTIQFRGVNAVNFGDYTDGFSPANTQGSIGTSVIGCSVADDYSRALGDPAENRLAAALRHQSGQGCPAPTGRGPGPLVSKPGAPPSATEAVVPKSPWQTNRILLP